MNLENQRRMSLTITEVKPRREKPDKREEPKEMLKDKAIPDIPLGMGRE